MGSSATFVNTQVEAYIFTLIWLAIIWFYVIVVYLSMHVPGRRAAARRALNPRLSKTAIYHGFRPAERSSIRPPILRTRLRACAWLAAAFDCVSNQSMESMICTPVSCLTTPRSLWHYHCNSQRSRRETSDDLANFIRMYSKSIESSGSSEFRMSLCRQVRRMTSIEH